MPRITHRSQKEKDDLIFFRRLLPAFVRKCESRVVQNIGNYKDWRNEESLLELRKRLQEAIRMAVVERNDGLMKPRPDKVPDKGHNPYIEIAVLAAVCHYHLDEQMQQAISSILGSD